MKGEINTLLHQIFIFISSLFKHMLSARRLRTAIAATALATVSFSLVARKAETQQSFRPLLKADFPKEGSNEKFTREFWSKRDGEHAWLEEVHGSEAMKFVTEQNALCLDKLGQPEASENYQRVLDILESKDKIPYIGEKIGSHYYNFWTDAKNNRGILRRTSLESYRTANPVWETVIDIDDLGKREKESWVYKGKIIYNPDNGEPASRVLLQLSRGGSDAVEIREFDLVTKSFVTDNAFFIPEAKSRVSWKDEDTLLIGTDFKDGKSMTDSGYPRTVRGDNVNDDGCFKS